MSDVVAEFQHYEAEMLWEATLEHVGNLLTMSYLSLY